MLNWLEAFRVQFLFFVLAYLFCLMRYLFNPYFFNFLHYKKLTIIVVTIMWLGFGTYYRCIIEQQKIAKSELL